MGVKPPLGGKQEFPVKKQRRNIFTFIEPRLHVKIYENLMHGFEDRDQKGLIWAKGFFFLG